MIEEQVWENYSPYNAISGPNREVRSWWSESASQVTFERLQKQFFAAPVSSSFSFLLHEQRKITTFFSKSVPTRIRPRKYGNRHREWRPMQLGCLGSILGAVPAWPSGSCGRNCNDWFYNPHVKFRFYLQNDILSIFIILISCGRSTLSPKAISYYIYSLWSENFV